MKVLHGIVATDRNVRLPMMQKRLREGLVVATPTKPLLEVVGTQAVGGVVVLQRFEMQILRHAVFGQQRLELVVAEPLESHVVFVHGLLAVIRTPVALLAQKQ